jgi:hypothetical protein
MFIKPLSQLEIVVVAVKSELVKYLLGGGGGGELSGWRWDVWDA